MFEGYRRTSFGMRIQGHVQLAALVVNQMSMVKVLEILTVWFLKERAFSFTVG